MKFINIVYECKLFTFMFYTNIDSEIGDVHHLFFSDNNILFEYN